MKKQTKKGFTLVELLVVIAILAVLATVSVVGYLGFTKKAKVSNDISLTTQMNTILQAEEAGGETFETPHDAFEALQNGGLDISKLTPTTNNYSYVYDLKQNRMFLLDENKQKVAPSNQEFTTDSDGNYTQLYAFVGKGSEMSSWSGYSFYLKDNFAFDSGDVTTVNAKSILGKFDTVHVMDNSNGTSAESKNSKINAQTGIDVGTNKNIDVNYSGTKDVVIRTQGDQSNVSIGGSGNVTFYGFAKKVEVKTSTSESETSTVNVVGSCKELTVESGNVKVEETAMITTATVNSGSKIESKGYVGEKKGNGEFDGKEGGNYEISTLSQLEAFRDTVNAGNDFSDFNTSGKNVVLTSDITLKNGWTPIGEGYREYTDGVSSTNATFFKGTFNGNNHTISNLNNSNYTPTSNRLNKGTKDTTYSYCYGLFALAEDATIKNLKLSNVNIDGERYSGANMDSVAALVGYAKGNCNISNITVSGTIKAYDAVAGIVGRWYYGSASNVIENCVNNANITAIGASNKGKAAGIVGYVNNPSSFSGAFVYLKNCKNTGNVTGIDYVGGLATFNKEEYVSADTSCDGGSVEGKGNNHHI